MLISSNVFLISILEPKKSAALVMKENNRAMEVDTVIIRNMVVVMDTALLVDTDILMEVILPSPFPPSCFPLTCHFESMGIQNPRE